MPFLPHPVSPLGPKSSVVDVIDHATLKGVCRDSSGNPVAGAVVDVVEGFNDTTNPAVLGRYVRRTGTVSDALGRYAVAVPAEINLQAVAYLPGAPDVAGVTPNTLLVHYGT